jgi:hypothetical protein
MLQRLIEDAFISEEVQSVNAPRLATQEIRLGGDRSWTTNQGKCFTIRNDDY